jgi:hypothetical protein
VLGLQLVPRVLADVVQRGHGFPFDIMIMVRCPAAVMT